MLDSPVDEFLIADSDAAAEWFAHRQLGWESFHAGYEYRKPDGARVRRVKEAEQLFGIKRGVVHVGPFTNHPESRATRRHLMNIAENRGLHLVPYDMECNPPEPMRICLVCGSRSPCMWPSDLQPGEPGVPCTFDPTPYEMHRRMRQSERENVRLHNEISELASAYANLEERLKAFGERLRAVETASKAYRSSGWQAQGSRPPTRNGAA